MLSEEIDEVLRDSSPELHSIGWLARCLQMSIRITIEEETYKEIMNSSVVVDKFERDAIFGHGQVECHMLFSWQRSLDGSSRFGHYDVLSPKTGHGDYVLPPDVFLAGKVTNYTYIILFVSTVYLRVIEFLACHHLSCDFVIFI